MVRNGTVRTGTVETGRKTERDIKQNRTEQNDLTHTVLLTLRLHYLPETASPKSQIFRKLCATPPGVHPKSTSRDVSDQVFPRLAIFIACYVARAGEGLGTRLGYTLGSQCIPEIYLVSFPAAPPTHVIAREGGSGIAFLGPPTPIWG